MFFSKLKKSLDYNTTNLLSLDFDHRSVKFLNGFFSLIKYLILLRSIHEIIIT